MILEVTDSEFDVTEEEYSTIVTMCFTAQLNQPRMRDAVFKFSISNSSTATNEDFFLNSPNITIGTAVFGPYMVCVDVTILGDDVFENDEVAVLNIIPVAEQDRVEFQFSNSSSLLINIFDNDGMQGHMQMHVM